MYCSNPDMITIDVLAAHKRIRLTGPRDWQDAGPRLLFWWQPTTAAVALASHVLGLGSLAGRRVLDVGCGLGLTGIAAGLAGASVVFLDCEATAAEFARTNALSNGLTSDQIDFLVSDWDDVAQIGSFDLVIGAEILYDYFFHDSLLRLFQASIADHGALLLADRKRLCVSRFLGRMRCKGFECKEHVATPFEDGFPVQQISIFELKSPQNHLMKSLDTPKSD
jgi:2-polyprenyl-3-methyl-5-hydroxy-6-metoxy-1,4-benzoquinol methylase